MSGVEAIAGLALGVLPLLISAIEHYDDCLRPFTRYKDFAKKAEQFLSCLGIQKAIFKNQCRILLEEIIEHDVASSMLSASSGAEHPSWSDLELEGQLSRLLGDSRGACITIIKMIEERLREVDGESQELAATIDVSHRKQMLLDDVLTTHVLQNIGHPVDSKTWIRCVGKKLRFSFSKPRLDQILCDLRSLNTDFQTLSRQTLNSTSLQSRRQDPPPKKPYQEVERYQMIGQASRRVYEALRRACTKHTEHQAHFCVEVEQAKITGDHSAQVKFSMAYTHMTLAGSVDQSDLIWFVVDSTSGDAVELRQSQIQMNPEDNFSQSVHESNDTAAAPVSSQREESQLRARTLEKTLKRQIEPPSSSKKRVRFQSTALASTCTTSSQSISPIATAILSSDSMRKDFCDLIRRRLREPLQASQCVCVLDDTDSSRNFVYPSSRKYCLQTRQAMSLEQVISRESERRGVGGIALYERLRLAKTLAIAVLQYHSTPWLTVSWRSEDIYFFGSELASAQEIPSLTSPHFNVKVKGPCGQLPRAPTFPPHNLVRNPLLFSLGVVLLEIAYNSTLDRLQRPFDLEDGQEGRYSEFFAARRLATSAKSDMGITYHKIVERLVECDFGLCKTDMNDRQLQAAFHRDVICPLEKLEQKLREFHLD